MSDIVTRNLEHIAVLAVGGHRNERTVDKDLASRNHHRLELCQRRQIHNYEHICLVDQRAADRTIGNDHGAVGCAAAHFRAVRRQPCYFKSFFHCRFGDHLTDCKGTLSACAGKKQFFLHIKIPPVS